MIPAIIFFLAVAVFIVLVARHVNIGKIRTLPVRPILQLIGAASLTLLSAIAIDFRKLMQRLFRKRERTRLPLERPETVSNGETPTVGTDDSFWSEEPATRPDGLLTNFEEGERLMKSGKFEEAESLFLKAATRSPKDARIYSSLGLIYLDTRSFSDAIEAFKVAVRLDKYNPSRHYNLAVAYWGNKDSQRAIASIREAIGLDPVTEKYRQFLEELLNSK